MVQAVEFRKTIKLSNLRELFLLLGDKDLGQDVRASWLGEDVFTV